MPINAIDNFKISPKVSEGVQTGKLSPFPSLNKGEESFQKTLEGLSKGIQESKTSTVSPASLKSTLVFSNHAIERMRQRGISYGPDMMGKIDKVLETAKQKGAKETLVITDNSALIVSLKNNKVITVMDKDNLKENIFTNIDSTVIV